MWLITPSGFFSIVNKPEDAANDTLTVRARVAADLDALREHHLPDLGPVVEHAGTDYRYRARAPRASVAQAMMNMVDGLHYENFKNEVARVQGYSRASVYGRVWDTLYHLQDNDNHVRRRLVDALPPAQRVAPVVRETVGLPRAYGGVLVDDEGRILLRRPAGDFDGYVWTFPKGRRDADETPEQTALREVREETGYEGRIAGRVPGRFTGGTSTTEFFLMTPADTSGEFSSHETAAVRWATLDEAVELIKLTTNEVGRARDLAVIDALRGMLRSAQSSGGGKP